MTANEKDQMMIDDILDFMRLAGDIARGAQNHLDASANYLKAESVTSVVTAADLEISQLFRQFVARRFADTDYVIIDEESLNTLGEDKWQRINQAEYQFIIDPIDGTLPYSCSQALYGISVGIFRRGKPCCGALYMPATRELACFDGAEVRLVREAFQPEEETEVLQPQIRCSCPIIFGHPWNTPLTEDFKLSETVFVNYYSAVVQLLYLVTQRARAYAFYMSIWDLAGGWTIGRAMGLRLYRLQDGQEITELSAADFDDNLHLKSVCVMCRSDDLAYVQKILEVAPRLR